MSESVHAPERFLLDTSAVLALTDQEAGYQLVEDLLDRAAASGVELKICAISLMELFYITLQEQGEDHAVHLVALVKAWPIEWVYPDETALLVAGRIKAFRRLSFADAVIAGVAKLLNATLVHKDPEFEVLAGEVSLLALPYKGAALS